MGYVKTETATSVATEPSLFDQPIASRIPDPPRVERPRRIPRANPRDEAETWIRDNPRGWAAFERFALEALRAGRPCGINLLRERVRWEASFVWGGDFKIDNRLSPYIARALIVAHPELESVLACRRTKW